MDVDKVVVVTGAGSGIVGFQQLLLSARFVVCADLNGTAAKQTASAVGPNSHAMALMLHRVMRSMR